MPAPNKTQVQVDDSFGGKKNLTIDTNRTDIYNETLFRSANMAAIPNKGIYSDALLWILTPAVSARLVFMLAPSTLAAIATTIFLLTPVLLLIFNTSLKLSSTHGFSCLYRLVLLFGGFVLACI